MVSMPPIFLHGLERQPCGTRVTCNMGISEWRKALIVGGEFLLVPQSLGFGVGQRRVAAEQLQPGKQVAGRWWRRHTKPG
jgi:hypothetical protein